MKKRGYIYLSIIFATLLFIFISNSAICNAECIDSTFAKQSYLGYETAQVEITSLADNDLKQSDIFLMKDNSQIYVQFFLVKLSQQKYFLFFDLPGIPGQYELRIRTYCDGNLKTSAFPIKVEDSIQNFYLDIKDIIKNNLNSITLEQLILSGKIYSYDKEFYEKIYSAYSLRNDNCVKKTCETKFAALSAISFPLTKDKILSQLIASQNSIEGNWNIDIKDKNAFCNISFNNQNNSLLENTTLDLGNYANEDMINISLECDRLTEATLNYNYLSVSKQFNFSKNGNTLYYYLNNNGCFGKSVKDECDVNSTIYALLALKENNQPINQKTINWLLLQNLNIPDKAITYYLSTDVDKLKDLKTSQSKYGWFPLSNENYKEDTISTAKTTFAMEKLNLLSNDSFSETTNLASTYLKTKFYSAGITNKENILFFAFDDKKIEPLVGIWPGILQTQSNGKFDLIIKNLGQNNLTANIFLFNSSYDFNISAKTIKKVTFNVPFIGTTDGRTIKENVFVKYNIKEIQGGDERGYDIPILVLTNISLYDTGYGDINYSYSEINESQIPTTIQNYTQIDAGLIQKNFYFTEKELKEDLLNIDGEKTFIIKLKNSFDSEIKSIEISPSSSLITLRPVIYPGFVNSIPKNGETEIKITINPSEAILSKQYSGEIIARGYLNDQRIETKIPVILNISIQLEEKTCSELSGKECGTEEICTGNITRTKDISYCCLGECKAKQGSQLIGLIILGVVLVILIGALLFFRKKPKKESSEFIKEAQKRYESTFQRPATHLKP